QQLWAPVTVSDLTFSLVAPLSSFILTSLLSLSPWNPAAARASTAFWAALASGAVIVTVLASRSHSPVMPSISLRTLPILVIQAGQQRWTFFSSTLTSARAVPAPASTRHRAAGMVHRSSRMVPPFVGGTTRNVKTGGPLPP